jgi:NAD(P)-dependent dehydrogenase (short-subunit alcohol dehydrogenase family)
MEGKRFGSTLEGKLVVITGASKGIGKGLAEIIAFEGARVAIAARDIDALEQVAAGIQDQGGECKAFNLDLRRVDSIKDCFSRIEEEMGPIDVLVNNAGMGNPIPAEEITEEDWDWMMDLNLKGTFFAARRQERECSPVRMVAS